MEAEGTGAGQASALPSSSGPDLLGATIAAAIIPEVEEEKGSQERTERPTTRRSPAAAAAAADSGEALQVAHPASTMIWKPVTLSGSCAW